MLNKLENEYCNIAECFELHVKLSAFVSFFLMSSSYAGEIEKSLYANNMRFYLNISFS